MQFITLLDYVLLPLYLFMIRQIARYARDRYYPEGHAWRPYFIPGLMVKMGGVIFISLVYQYYYGNGDTVLFYKQTLVVNSSFWESPIKWFNLVFHIPDWYDANYSSYISQLPWYNAGSNYIVVQASALVGILCFNTYLCTSLVMGAIAYTGLWALFRTFAKQYKHITGYIAVCCLYIPSVAIWGSGIFKDTLCIFGLGWLTYTVFKMLVERKFSIFNIVMMLFSGYIIGVAKIYILIAFLPSLVIWILLTYSYRIRSAFARFLIIPLSFGVIIVGFMFISNSYGDLLGMYSADQFVERSAITRNYIIGTSSDESSTYDLGSFDPSVQGMLKKFPAAVNVTLFRPYIWESRKPIVFLNGLESLLLFFLVLKLIFQLGPKKILKAIAADPNIQFCLIFTFIFAFAIGISSGNFGALSRYRIPCLPLFGIALGLIFYSKYSPDERKFLPFGEKNNTE